jgi:ribosomal protein S4
LQTRLPRIKRAVDQQQDRKQDLIKTKGSSALPYPPTTMLTFAFIERRVDTILFRSCFVPSIWEARYLVNTGSVHVNGKPVRLGGYVCEDGDIIQVVRPERMSLLNGNHRALGEDLKVQIYKESEDGDETADVNEDDEAKLSEDETSDEASTRRRRTHGYKPDKDYGFHPAPYMAPWMFVPEYLEVNYNNLSVCFLRSPTVKPGRCEIPSPYDEIVHQRAFDLYSHYRVPF